MQGLKAASPAIGGENEPSRLGDVTTLKVTLALLLVVTHGLTHLHQVPERATHLLAAVPVFMFLSGYFLFANYKRSPNPAFFMASRYFRLLPIMVVNLVVTLALVVLIGGWPMPSLIAADIPQFVFMHLTVFQNYVPASFGALEVSVRNGSLWFVEAILILYASLPLIAFIERRIPQILAILCAASACLAVAMPAYTQSRGGPLMSAEHLTGLPIDETLSPLMLHVLSIGFRVVSSAWMFYAGCLIRRHQARLFAPNVCVALISASLTVTLILYALEAGQWNHFGPTPPWFFAGYIVAWVVLHKGLLVRFSVPPISIGLFVWHMPVFHALNYLDLGELWLAAPLVVMVAWFSLHVIERPLARILSPRLPALGAKTVHDRGLDRGGMAARSLRE